MVFIPASSSVKLYVPYNISSLLNVFDLNTVCYHLSYHIPRLLQMGPLEGAVFADYGTDLGSGPSVPGMYLWSDVCFWLTPLPLKKVFFCLNISIRVYYNV